MEFMDVEKLKPHSKNRYFFDDMDGEPWTAFLESIETSGIIEPIIVTQDLTIVSGHQRVRAAKKLGIKEVAVEMRNYDTEDEVLKQLIEANVRQRGVGNTNMVKVGRCAAELERIYGIKHGNNQHKEDSTIGGTLKTQEDLLEELGINKESYRRAKKLATLPEEIQQMVMDGKITASVASRVIARLSPDERKQLVEQIAGKEKVSGKDVEQYIQKIKDQTEENERLKRILSEKEAENVRLKSQKPEVREIEVKPSDYDLIQKERKQYLDERNKANARIKELEEREGIHDAQMKLERESEYLETQINTFIRTTGGYVWITEKITELPEDKRMNVIKAIKNINAWSQQMLTNIGGNLT